MTLEEICNCSAEKLEKLIDKELEQHFAPFFAVTRPEIAAKMQPKQKKTVVLSPEEREYQRKIERGKMLARQLGFKI